MYAAVSEIEPFKNWVFFPRSEIFLFTSLILLNIVKNTCPMRKFTGNELEVYLFSFKLRSNGQLQVQCFSQKWHITEHTGCLMKNASTHNFVIYYPISMNKKIKDMVFQALQNSHQMFFLALSSIANDSQLFF
jgi:hypothetical protein